MEHGSSRTRRICRDRLNPCRPVAAVLLTRKSFAAWKECFFADFFALFASWRLAGPHFHREDAKDAKKTPRIRF